MAFPADPLDVTVELNLDGVWTDITGYVLTRDRIEITRGLSSEGNQVEPSTLHLSVNNTDGRFSPRNPTGALYGSIGRNTPIRVRKSPASDGYVLLPHGRDITVSTPDSAGLSVTGDIDVRIDVALDRWDLTGEVGLMAKYLTTGDQRSWALWLGADRTVSLAWTTAGTLASRITATSTAAIPDPGDGGRVAIRATLDVNDGAGGLVVTYYTADSIDGTWVQLGGTATGAFTTSIFDSTAQVEIGTAWGAVPGGVTGRVYAAQVYSGIAGTLRADPDFRDQDGGDGSFTDSIPNTWTVAADASLVDPSTRFVGEVAAWPARWDLSGTDVWVPVDAAGVLRRLGQGAAPLSSTMYQGITSLDDLVAYWPCEDGSDATRLGSAAGGPSMRIIGGTANLASSSEFACSAPLPEVNSTRWHGAVPAYTTTGQVQVRMLAKTPSTTADGAAISSIYCTGTAAKWNLYYDTGGDLELQAVDADGTEIFNTGPIAFGVDGKLIRISVELDQNGSDIDFNLEILEVGGDTWLFWADTVASRTVGRCTGVAINTAAPLLTDTVIGHISVQSEITSLLDLADELDAYIGETAARRIERLCAQQGVTFRCVGDPDDSTRMGAQGRDTPVNLIREAETADMGVMYEPRDFAGLAYRTRASLYDQQAAVTLDYASGHLSDIEPVEDDQATRNDVTVTRTGGSSTRRVLESGPMSVLAPPDGVGRYDEETTINVEADTDLPDQAGWRLHLGTVDEARFPVIGTNLARAVFTADPGLYLAVQDLDVGDRLVVENPPPWMPPDDIAQISIGFVEQMANFEHTIGVNCAPASPWDVVARWDGDDARLSSDGSTLAEDLTTTETAVDVATPSGPLWTTDAGDLPLNIRVGGEVMTVTAISGSSSPQTFTVTRSVNSVVKTHATGAAVELAQPMRWAL